MSRGSPKVRRHKPRVSPAQAGLLGILAIALACWFVFGGTLPFSSSPFVLRAAFTANTYLHIPSPVRVAGVEVGQVVSVRPISGSPDAGIVTMHINQSGLPIHADATATIRSRIFLEGNFYVQLDPGTPRASVLESGATLPAANTAGPVQLDRVLSSLDTSARSNLQTLVRGLGAALNAPARRTDERGQDPNVARLTGAQGLNESLRYAPGAFEASALVNQALLGESPHDLSGAVSGLSKVFQGLASSQSQLQGLITTFNGTMAALVARQQALGQTIRALPPLLRSADVADSQLDASFPPTQAFARAILPGVRQLGPTLDAAIPWLAQLTALNSPSELGALVADLPPTVQRTSELINPLESLIEQAGGLARCFTGVVLPASNEAIQDPPNTTGLKAYQELFQSAVGIASATQNFDGNGRYVRASVGGGSQLVQTIKLPNGPLFGNAVLTPLGARPAFPGKAPPINGNRACFRNPVPQLNHAATGGTP